MAVGEIVEKLYPPVIDSSLPAFYGENNGDGTTSAKIVVPFSMNRAVNINYISGFSLKIKTVQSNTLIAILYSNDYSEKEVTFNWPNVNSNDTGKKINIGQFLKVQLAYTKNIEKENQEEERVIGYYSTVGIIKYTSKPKVYIENLGQEIGRIDIFKSEYTGIYETSEDKSERPYSYKFSLYDNNLSLVETSDWKLHNTSINNIASESMSLDKATDLYCFNMAIQPDVEYYLQYSVRTINNLEINSPLYACIEPETEEPNLKIDLKAENIFEEGYINLFLNLDLELTENDTILSIKKLINKYKEKYKLKNIIQKPEINSYIITNLNEFLNENTLEPYIKIQYENSKYTISICNLLEEDTVEELNYISIGKNGASIEICRAESTDKFQSWKTLQKIYFSDYEDILQWEFKDFTIEQGITYQYCFRQYNDNVKSNRKISNIVMADFEDMFLYDGKRQLKIRFNPKVSSFKTNHLEQKTDTIGSRYPFIFRNGIIDYKEFPISGLISYYMDNNELFLNHKEDLNILLGKNSSRWMGTSVNYSLQSNELTGDIINEEDNIIEKSWEISETLDSIGYNMRAERRFKLKLLEWLGNGEIKMFKSPAEGNYLVRLMNISLTPEDKLGRMIHNFSCTAYEIQEYTYNNLKDLGFFNYYNNYVSEYEIKTIKLQEVLFEQQVNGFDKISSISDVVQINDFPIYEFMNFYIPSTGRFGNSLGFYIRFGSSSQTKVLISPARGFMINDIGHSLSDIYFCPQDNLELINYNNEELSIVIEKLKDLIGDTQIDYKYQNTVEKVGAFNNIVDAYLKTEVKTINGPNESIYFNIPNNEEEHLALKIYTLNFKKKDIQILWRKSENEDIYYWNCTDSPFIQPDLTIFTTSENGQLSDLEKLTETCDDLVDSELNPYSIYAILIQDNEYNNSNKIKLKIIEYCYIFNNSLITIEEAGEAITSIDDINTSIILEPKKNEDDENVFSIEEPPSIDIVQDYDKIIIGNGIYLDCAYLDKVIKRSG